MTDYCTYKKEMEILESELEIPSFSAIKWFNQVYHNKDQRIMIIYILTERIKYIKGDKNASIHGLRNAFGLVPKEYDLLYDELLKFIVKKIVNLSKIQHKSFNYLVSRTINFLCSHYSSYYNFMRESILFAINSDGDEQKVEGKNY